MRLSTRLTILLVVITTTVALLVGWFAVANSSRADYATLNSNIDAVIASGNGHPLTALSSALNAVQRSNLDLTLDVIGPTGSVTQVLSGDVPLSRTPTLADVRGSLGRVRASGDLPGFRYRSMDIGGGDYLLVAGSTKEIAQRSHQLVIRTVLVGVLADALMGVVARIFMRRDLRTVERLISYATAIADGDVGHSIPDASGSTDIRELQLALSSMVAALRHTIETEQRLAKSTQQFIGDASHELRTPLTVIRGYTELLANTAVDDDQHRRALDRIKKEVVRMDLLVNDLLFLAEVNEAAVPEEQSVDLSDLVTSSVHDFTVDHPERPLESAVAPGLKVHARRDHAVRLIVNALANIARHTSDADPVRISLVASGANASLVIEDGGPGLPESAYGTKPERFRRFDDARSRSHGGSGLGMSIMSDVATTMGGTMTTSKSSLGGLALTFNLPLASAPPT